MQPIISRQYNHICNTQYIACNKSKVKQVMLDLWPLYALGLALLRVKLLKTCGLLTSKNLLLDLHLLWNEPTDVGSYMR
jgi:hypothetical protein